MLFKEIPGHKDLKDRLRRNVREEKIPHAELFLGPPGSASLALALALATYIHCEQRLEDDSCGICSSCIKNKKLIHPDLHFSFPFAASRKDEHANSFIKTWREALLAQPYLSQDSWIRHLHLENKQLNINIEECHQIHAKLSMKPFEATFQILIMWLPEFLGKEGNSLLKFIEEPSSSTLLIFVAENKDAILPTILSRMQLVKVKGFKDEEIREYLHTHYPNDEERLDEVAFLAEGNMELAIHALSSPQESLFDMVNDWMHIAHEGNPGKLVGWVDHFSKSGKENQGPEARKRFLAFSMHMVREALLLSEQADALVRLNKKDKLRAWASYVHHENAYPILSALDKAIYHVERNANAKILFLDVSLQLHVLLNKQPRAQTV